MNQTPAAGYRLLIAAHFDPNDPTGRDRLATASRTLQRSFGLSVVALEEIPLDQLPPMEPGRRRGDEAIAHGQRLDSGLTPTKESRLEAMVARAKRKEAKQKEAAK